MNEVVLVLVMVANGAQWRPTWSKTMLFFTMIFFFAIILVEGDPHKGQGDAAAVAASGQCPGPGNEQWERAVQP